MSVCFDSIIPAQLTWAGDVPYSLQFADIYFSIEHGLFETKHVFIDGNRLTERWKNLNEDPFFVIAECGFGTGLNLLLAWKYFKEVAPKHAQLHFISAEKHPLSLDDLKRCLALWPELHIEAEGLLNAYPQALTPGFHHCVLEEGRVFLTLMLGDAGDMFDSLLLCKDDVLEPELRQWSVDAWFLDGFAPAKNPHMWSESLFTTMALLSNTTTTVATFSAAGHVRRGLQEAGFCVFKQSGYGKKHSMTVGFFEKMKTVPRASRCTPWHVPHVKQSSHEKKAIVLGSGLAGCFTAHALAKRGWHVTVIEQASTLAEGASGNQQVVLYPNFSAFRAPLTTFMLSAFIHAVRVYKPWIDHKFIQGELNGILQLAWNDKATQHFLSLASWFKEYPSLGRLVDSIEASELTGIHLNDSGLFIPHAGWVNSPALCEFLVQSPLIKCVFNQRIDEIYFDDHWHVGSHQAPVVVLATGFNATSLSQTEHLSLLPFKGQMTAVTPTSLSAHLKIPLCAKGHVLPEQQGTHWIGATYHPGHIDSVCNAFDDEKNMQTLAFLSADSIHEAKVHSHWAGVRAVTRDYLPLVGPVADCDLFNHTFSTLQSNAKRFIAHSGPHHPGLYLCAGFGSRGLTTIPLSAEYLAASIAREPFCLPRDMVQSIAPARFLIRSLTRL